MQRAKNFRWFKLCFWAAAAIPSPAHSQDRVVTSQPPYPAAVVPMQSNGLPIGVPETTGGIYGEPLQRYDAPYPWMHGYFQEIPAYEGYAAFRPYNYKHILAQSQVAGGWGMPPSMPYAQQFWHRYRKRALMMPDPSLGDRSRDSAGDNERPVMWIHPR